jgi:hypothetical protein
MESPLGPCFEVPGSSTIIGTQLDQYECVNQTNEKWYFHNVGGDLYQIRNGATNKCMSIANSATFDGAAVIQWDCAPRDHEYFRVLDSGRRQPSTYYLIQNDHSSKCLDVESASVASGAKLTQWTCNKDFNNEQVRLN